MLSDIDWACLEVFYDIRSENGAGLFLQPRSRHAHGACSFNIKQGVCIVNLFVTSNLGSLAVYAHIIHS